MNANSMLIASQMFENANTIFSTFFKSFDGSKNYKLAAATLRGGDGLVVERLENWSGHIILLHQIFYPLIANTTSKTWLAPNY